jgi:hypothetical protein
MAFTPSQSGLCHQLLNIGEDRGSLLLAEAAQLQSFLQSCKLSTNESFCFLITWLYLLFTIGRITSNESVHVDGQLVTGFLATYEFLPLHRQSVCLIGLFVAIFQVM